MLCVCQQLQQYNTSRASSTSDLPLRTNKFCSLLFVMVVHAAGCDKYSFTDALPTVQ